MAFPPPLCFIGYLVSTLNYIQERNSRARGDSSKVGQEDDELFLEKKYAQKYLKNKQILERDTVKAQLKVHTKKLEYLERRLDEIHPS
jgi:hypothetical protein